GREPLLELTPEDRQRGRECLKQLGVPPERWFVTLHVRETGYKPSDIGFRHRNADLDSYLPAIDALIQRGGFVVRLGSPHMRPATPRNGFIDYAHSSLRSDWMDIFLIAEGLFHIGVESGISHLPVTFGLPSLYANWMRWGILPWCGDDL